jgi:cell wall-associated NlpC family hydrolase
MRMFLIITVAMLIASCKSRSPERATAKHSVQEQLVSKSGFPLDRKIPESLASAALVWWGTPYKYGGTGKNGIDCSGLVVQVFNEVYKKSLPRTTSELITQGKKVAAKKAAAGDLIFFTLDGKKVSHVGIMLDSIHFLHASTSKGVRIDSREQEFWAKRLAAIIRLSFV